ncbi:carbamoyl transferase [Candidatus Micrarchaeota archaeon]|nr:carbamoyl transferase [Candidatus Micrarchaeota archaeon]
MIILGVSNTKDSGAALIKNGEIVAAANEERFTRKKLIRAFPLHSIQYVLEEGGVKWEDVDAITTGAWKGLNQDEILMGLVEDVIWNAKNDPESGAIIMQRTKVAVQRDATFKKELVEELGKRNVLDKLHYVDHHLAHAASAHHCSPFSDSLTVVMDGRGDFKANSVYCVRNNALELVDCSSHLNSLGFVYAFVTRYLGFTPDKHEGKVTGLAAFGDAQKTVDIFRKMVSIDENGRIRAHVGKYYSPFLTAQIPVIEEELAKHKKEDVAAGVQAWLEETVVKFVSFFLEKYPMRHVCLAGGIFANVRVNQKVREIPGVDNVYIHPHMGDGGLSLGSALAYWYEHGGRTEKPLETAFLGPEFSDDKVEETLRKSSEALAYVKVQDKAKAVAKLLSEDQIVGWFQGRMEYGPRALGHRSILAAATDKNINHNLNQRLHRTEFMPFAPMTLEEYASSSYIDWNKDHISSRFMTICYYCHPIVKKQSPAIVHVDNTARPQIVGPKDNPDIHALITQYHRLTGIPTIVNTSFNNHEEPILCSPQDAVDSLLRDNVDVLCIGNFLVVPKGKEFRIASVSDSTATDGIK